MAPSPDVGAVLMTNRGRAIPLLWSAVKGKQGHLLEELH
jgi:hypothetical protein